jgi:hypothetical protein
MTIINAKKHFQERRDEAEENYRAIWFAAYRAFIHQGLSQSEASFAADKSVKVWIYENNPYSQVIDMRGGRHYG